MSSDDSKKADEKPDPADKPDEAKADGAKDKPADKPAKAKKAEPAKAKPADAEKADADDKKAPAAKKPAAKKAAAKKKKVKPPPEVREGKPIAGGVVAPKGTKFNREEIIARALEKIRATQTFETEQAKDASQTRRDLFASAGWAGFTGFMLFLGGCFARFFFPRVLFEPPTKFKAGFPSEYAVGEVSSKYKKTNRVWIIREATGFYAVFARCTHLGCTPIWLEGEQKFKCPCHGSGYTKEAINYEGPAPRPMERCNITLSPDGQLQIDRNNRYVYQSAKGWDSPGAYLYA